VPLLDEMAAFEDLDPSERAVLGKLRAYPYWTAVVHIDGLPPDAVIFPIDVSGPLAGQRIPGPYSIVPTPITGTYNILYGSEERLSDTAVHDDIVRVVERMSQRAFDGPVRVRDVEKIFSHWPYGVHVAPHHIEAGFYLDLLSLQGHNRTYYVGAAMDTNETRAVWAHAEALIRAQIGARELSAGQGASNRPAVAPEGG